MTLLDARWVGVSSPWPNSVAFGPNRPFGSIDIRLASALQRAMHSAMPLHGSFLGEKITLTRWLGSLCSALSGVVLFTNPGSAGVLAASWFSPDEHRRGRTCGSRIVSGLLRGVRHLTLSRICILGGCLADDNPGWQNCERTPHGAHH